MKNVAVINGISCTRFTYETLIDGKNAFDAVLAYAGALPHVEKVVLLGNMDTIAQPSCEAITKASWNVGELLHSLKEVSKGCDVIFYCYADCPYLDAGLAGKMYRHHKQSLADYTCSDGYPYGLTPELISHDIISRLITLSGEGKDTITRESIFNLIKTDINAFDIETELAPKDLRLLRVSLTADTKRNFMLLERLASEKATSEPSIIRLLDENPMILRTLPAYYSIQISEPCPQTCTYCPYPLIAGEVRKKTGYMSYKHFKSILDDIETFSDDAVIGLSLWGEPALHPEIASLAGEVLKRKSLSLVIETSGIGWNESVLKEIARYGKKQCSWIVSLDAWSKEIYRMLRGEGYEEAYRTVSILREINPKQVYVQAVRMKDNEDDLEQFYKNWHKETENVIVQKYDAFSEFLPDKKVTDLSPLNRFPCWHVKREMAVLIDGTVPLCREDIRREHILGNVFEDSIDSIWNTGESFYRLHTGKDYPDICKRCDEYYTYNF
ncbi:MAG: spiro-SPASM protein [Spirochaetales bacterium]|nr:spiro-SPASM protein [Spirochaetales bacterium]